MKTHWVDYPCGCWYVFNGENEHHWKLIDFEICDECLKKHIRVTIEE